MFSGLLEGAKKFMDSAVDKVADMALESETVMSAINQRTERYAEVKQLSRVPGGLKCIALPKGSSEIVEVTVTNIRVADDNSSVRIGNIDANREWVRNSLQDFVQGKDYPIPEAVRGIVGKAKAVICR